MSVKLPMRPITSFRRITILDIWYRVKVFLVIVYSQEFRNHCHSFAFLFSFKGSNKRQGYLSKESCRLGGFKQEENKRQELGVGREK